MDRCEKVATTVTNGSSSHGISGRYPDLVLPQGRICTEELSTVHAASSNNSVKPHPPGVATMIMANDNDRDLGEAGGTNCCTRCKRSCCVCGISDDLGSEEVGRDKTEAILNVTFDDGLCSDNGFPRLSQNVTENELQLHERKWKHFPGKNKFYLDGRLMTAPSVKFCMLSFLLILVTFVLFIAVDGPYFAREISIAIPITGGVLFVLVIVNMFKTSCSDPGILPRASQQESEFVEKSYAGSNGARPPPRTKDIIVKGQTIKSKYCFTCKMFRPPRASHCSVCDNCVDRFDHHCPFLGNCIGKRNYRNFYAFIVCLSLLAIFVLSFSITKLAMVGKERGNFLDALKESPTSAIVILISFLGMWTVIGLAGFHTYLIAVEQTTNEDIKGMFGRANTVNPYSKGNFCQNCCFILCGPYHPSLIDSRGVVTPDFLASLPKRNGGNDSMMPSQIPATSVQPHIQTKIGHQKDVAIAAAGANSTYPIQEMESGTHTLSDPPMTFQTNANSNYMSHFPKAGTVPGKSNQYAKLPQFDATFTPYAHNSFKARSSDDYCQRHSNDIPSMSGKFSFVEGQHLQQVYHKFDLMAQGLGNAKVPIVLTSPVLVTQGAKKSHSYGNFRNVPAHHNKSGRITGVTRVINASNSEYAYASVLSNAFVYQKPVYDRCESYGTVGVVPDTTSRNFLPQVRHGRRASGSDLPSVYVKYNRRIESSKDEDKRASGEENRLLRGHDEMEPVLRRTNYQSSNVLPYESSHETCAEDETNQWLPIQTTLQGKLSRSDIKSKSYTNPNHNQIEADELAISMVELDHLGNLKPRSDLPARRVHPRSEDTNRKISTSIPLISSSSSATATTENSQHNSKKLSRKVPVSGTSGSSYTRQSKSTANLHAVVASYNPAGPKSLPTINSMSAVNAPVALAFSDSNTELTKSNLDKFTMINSPLHLDSIS